MLSIMDDDCFPDEQLCRKYKRHRTWLWRQRQKGQFPKPDFWIGDRGFTYLSTIKAYETKQAEAGPPPSRGFGPKRQGERAA
jgi:hypothetical protein